MDLARAASSVVSVGRATVVASRRDRIGGLSAEMAFWFTLALVPLLLVLLGGLGFVGDVVGQRLGDALRGRLLEATGAVFAEDVRRETVAPALNALLDEGRAGIASLGVLVSLFGASRALAVILRVLQVAYGGEPRSRLRRRLLAVGMTVGFVGVAAVVFPLLVAGPRLGERLAAAIGLGELFGTAWETLYWPTAGVVTVLLLTALYTIGTPTRSRPRTHLPGAVLAVGVWLLGTAALRAYTVVALSGDGIYRQVATPLSVLLWLYVIGFAVLLGAELNATAAGRRQVG